MIVQFKTKDLRDLCNNKSIAVRKIGPNCAKSLHKRLADLNAFNSVSELVAGNPHPLKGNREGQFAVSLAGGVRLIFAPIPDSSLFGNTDWSQISEIMIIEIGDYHE